jgi:hypothetical protein
LRRLPYRRVREAYFILNAIKRHSFLQALSLKLNCCILIRRAANFNRNEKLRNPCGLRHELDLDRTPLTRLKVNYALFRRLNLINFLRRVANGVPAKIFSKSFDSTAGWQAVP